MNNLPEPKQPEPQAPAPRSYHDWRDRGDPDIKVDDRTPKPVYLDDDARRRGRQS